MVEVESVCGKSEHRDKNGEMMDSTNYSIQQV